MEKQNAAKICATVGLVLAAVFVVMLGLDWWRYSTTLNSAPFWVTAAVDGVFFLLPALVFLLIAHTLGKK